jgi:RNA recognition motif-containing protein
VHRTPVIYFLNKLEDMFPTLTSFERDLNNPYLNRTMTQATTVVKASTALVPTNTPATSKLLISNLPLSFDQNAVYQILRTFGKIKNIELIKDPITGKSSGNCHVEYETETATANALHCKKY